MLLSDGARKYVYGLNLAYSIDTGGNLQVSHADTLGSVRALTDGSGNLTQTYRTDPFGVPVASQGPSTQPIGFTGEQRDSETGFVYLRARMYDPMLPRGSATFQPGEGIAVVVTLWMTATVNAVEPESTGRA